MLTKEEMSFYNRQLLLPEIGEAGQKKLQKAKVLVVGAGGLGCPVSTYLAAAGVGTIGIIDGDVVNKSNLHRQVLFGFSQIGVPKVEAAIERLKDLNPNINLKGYFEKLEPENALRIISDYNIIVDATDNFPSRYLINDVCIILNKPFVLGSIDRFQGQLCVMNFKNTDGLLGPSYRCLFPIPPIPESAPNCEQNGVIGFLPGIIGTMQANEVIKMIVGFGKVLSGKLLVLDTTGNISYTIKIERNDKMIRLAQTLKDNLQSFDYADFCHLENNDIIKIDPATLIDKIENKDKVQIIDIRENGNTDKIDGAIRLPLSKITESIDNIDRDIPLIVYCEYGITSMIVVGIFIKAGFKNVYNLKGGLSAWKKELEKAER